MKVYVVEIGVYNDRYIAGVYATQEAAQRSCEWAGGTWKENDPFPDGRRWWENDRDWSNACTIWEWEVGQ